MTFENNERRGKPRRQEPETPSSHLWVGNLGPEVTESELSDLFSKYGPIDGITCYASRTYAFVYFKRVEDASAAKLALQGFPLSSGPTNTTTTNLKIEFAKPAKPSKHVWVGGFSSSVTKEKLEEELTKVGKIEDFKFNRDRNTALVDFVRVEDASAAVKNLSGLEIDGDRIRVDFLRSHPSRRQEQSDFHEFGSAQFRGMGGPDYPWSHPDIMRNYPEPPYLGNKRMQPPQPLGSRKAGQHPSKVLWVGYPPSVAVDEEMLHNAMILHGEIERIKCFSGRNYSFVEFRSVEEARRAKDALQGRLFDDPRINIMFSNSELAPGKDFGPPFSSMRGQGPDMFSNDVPFRPPHMDMFSSNRALAPNNFSAGLLGPGIPRPFGPRGSSDPLLPTPDFGDSNMSDLPTNAPLGLNKRKMSPPLTGLLSTPPNSRPLKTSGWDVLDPSQLPRDSKRSRIDGLNEPTGRDDFGDTPYPAGPLHLGGPVHADDDFIWRGVIAKGGTPVCRARCIPIENGLECELPSVVNCSARTGLDMLAKHCAGADGFDIVFFLPDSEEDFANYTEFLRYLGSKDRAGVAKLDDGTTLFLVPPSDFLANVLKVACRERLYGVVLRLPQQLPAGPATSQQTPQPIPPIQYMDRQLPHTHDYAAPNNEMAAQADYGRAADGTMIPPRAPYSAVPVSKEPTNDSAPTSQPGVSLTPELIATLTKLLPANAQPSLVQNTQPQLGPSATGPPPMPSSQGWNQPPHLPDQMGHFSQQFGSQVYGNPQVPTSYQPYAPNLNQTSQPIPVNPEVMQAHNSPYNNQDQGYVPSRPPITHPAATQSQQYMPSTQGVQPYSFELPNNNTPIEYAGAHGAPAGHYVNQLQGANPQNNLPSAVGNVHVEQTNQAQRFQPVPSGVGQSTAEVEVDKNQRYQSTLQFAANLLMQIQQQQQQKQ